MAYIQIKINETAKDTGTKKDSAVLIDCDYAQPIVAYHEVSNRGQINEAQILAPNLSSLLEYNTRMEQAFIKQKGN